MEFTRIRLSGFKSFVDTAEFRIEPGLTGVVGPNGCGKSNILEAMRWAMGAASPKAMRGEGMDDVIFAGSSARPSRNHAEVTLTIDNSDGAAPAAFNAEPVLEVTRRIDRGEGSTYRVNGREVRARDVQILFADASSGANSPALVRQGQISELISSKPQNRRRILEEAAGVSGLHGRRHEAELRVAAAAANLERLDDVARELELGLTRLRREARQATRYKSLAAEIRSLHAALLQQKWAEARAAAERASSEMALAQQELEEAARAAAVAAAKALGAEAEIWPLREADAAAALALGGLAIEKDRVDRDLELARNEASRLVADIARIDADDAREAERLEDTANASSRLEAEAAMLQRELDEAPQRLPALQAAAISADAERVHADAELERLAAAQASAEADLRAARARLGELEARLTRLKAAAAETESELGGLAPGPETGAAAEGLKTAADRLAAARAAQDQAEAVRDDARRAEIVARNAARSAEDELAGAVTEARALTSLAATPADRNFAAILDQVAPHAGFEAALAAALGDDLDAAIDPRAPAFWAGAEAGVSPVWPKGARPLGEVVDAPPQLAARLAFTALVDAADGERLQGALPPGARLVSQSGDLWRWDGYIQRAAAPRPAEARLAQKARLAALDIRIAEMEPQVRSASQSHARATAEVEAAEVHLRAARATLAEAETALTACEALERQNSQREARRNLLAHTLRGLELEIADAEKALGEQRALASSETPDVDFAGSLQSARAAASAAREAASRAKAALEFEAGELERRQGRLAALTVERTDWSNRGKSAATRREALTKERDSAAALLAASREAPARTQVRVAELLSELLAAEALKAKAADALAQAETARSDADRQARAADARAADSREARAGLAARLEAARERLTEQAEALAEASGAAVAQLEARFGDTPHDAQPGAAEARLAMLEREREAMGPVNLRAEEEAGEQAARLTSLGAERADLAGALTRLRQAIGELNAEGRTRLMAAFEVIQGHFRDLFVTLFDGGQAELRLVESEDPLEAGLEVLACPPGKRMAVMSLMSGGEQALTAMALIFAVFLSNPAPVCVLDEADAPLDDANVERFCNLLSAMRARAATRFIVITHNPLTMSRMDRLYGVTMREAGISQLVSVDLRQAELIAAQ